MDPGSRDIKSDADNADDPNCPGVRGVVVAGNQQEENTSKISRCTSHTGDET